MVFSIFYSLKAEEKTTAIEKLVTNSAARQEFFIMLVLSVLMATFGLLIGNESIIIGSMLIAPVLHPLLGITLSVVLADFKLLKRSSVTFGKMCLFAILSATLVTLFFSKQAFPLTEEILSRTHHSLVYFAIAVVAGLAVSFAVVKETVSESLPGVAISVALMPPLAVIGIGLARLDWTVMSRSFLLFVINALGISFSAMIVYSLMGFAKKRILADKVADITDKVIAKEKKQAEHAEKIDTAKEIKTV